MDKNGVARVLREMSQLLRTAKASAYKSRAYERAADQLLELHAPLEEMVGKGKLRSIPGIGRSLEHAITELVLTGKLSTYDQLRSQYSPFVAQLAELPGLGPKRALALWRLLKIESLDALEQAIHEGRLENVRGFGPKTRALLLRGLMSRHERQPHRYRLVEGVGAAKLLLAELRSNSSVERAELAGDARRFCETIDGIQLLVASNQPGPVLDDFSRSVHVFEVKSRSENSLTGQLFRPSLPVRIDICTPGAFVFRWVKETGSEGHIEGLHARAVERGVDLNAGKLDRGTRRLSFESEAEVYDALGCAFITPEMREGMGEIEAAERGNLPVPIELDDVIGLVHSHSTWSDGNASLEQMARAACEKGYRYMTVTDHSPTAFYARGLTIDSLQRQWEEIDSLNERFPRFRLLKGTESDITAGGRSTIQTTFSTSSTSSSVQFMHDTRWMRSA